MSRFPSAPVVWVASPATEPVPLPDQFEQLADGFVLERIAQIVRIHHGPCAKHKILSDDATETVTDAQSLHVCGPRVSPWHSAGGDQ